MENEYLKKKFEEDGGTLDVDFTKEIYKDMDKDCGDDPVKIKEKNERYALVGDYELMSKSEIEVAEYLIELKFKALYEYPVFVYDEKNRPRVWTPDFYLPELKIHVEVCGSDEYYNSYSYRDKVFKKNGVGIIFLHAFKEEKEWKKFFIKKVQEIEEERHKRVTSMIHILLDSK